MACMYIIHVSHNFFNNYNYFISSPRLTGKEADVGICPKEPKIIDLLKLGADVYYI